MTRTTLLPVAPHAAGWAVHPWADVLLPEPAADTETGWMLMADAGEPLRAVIARERSLDR